jgi:hypothetical protein
VNIRHTFLEALYNKKISRGKNVVEKCFWDAKKDF